MKPEQQIDFPLSLVAAIPGTYRGPASRTYLYYTDEFKTWTDGLAVEIARTGQLTAPYLLNGHATGPMFAFGRMSAPLLLPEPAFFRGREEGNEPAAGGVAGPGCRNRRPPSSPNHEVDR